MAREKLCPQIEDNKEAPCGMECDHSGSKNIRQDENGFLPEENEEFFL